MAGRGRRGGEQVAQDAGTAAEGSIDSHGAPDVTLGDAELDSLASRIAGRSAEPAAGPPRRRHARAQAAEAPVMGLLGVLDAVPVALAPGSIPSATAPVPADMASGRASATRGRVPAAGKPPKAGKEAKHYHGHRERLRDRFLQQGAVALQDYELLEMLLFSIDARNDVKPLAKRLLQKYGSLWAVVNAPVAKLREDFSSDVSVAKILIVGAIGQRMARQELLKKPVLSSWQKLLDYCEGAMSHEPTEQFRLLFLDRKNTLIADEVQQRGTVDHAPVYPREVVKRALELGATAIILVHNHPSGDPTPSRADIDMTKQIVQAAGALGVVIHDHLIIGKGGKHVSFKATGLM